MKTLRAAACVATLACLCCCPRGAAAETGKEQAKVLFKKASELFDRGMYLDALQRFRQARALYPSFKIDLNIGATLDAMGRRTEAAVYFEKFLVNAAKAPPEIIKAATKRLGELRNKLGRVKVTCLVVGATVMVNHKAVGRIPLELAVYLEPGKHTLKAEKTGYLPGTVELILDAGEYRELDLPLKPEAETAPVTPRPASAPSVTVKPPPPASAPVEASPAGSAVNRSATQQRRRSKTIQAFIALGVGAALTVAAGTLLGVGAGQGSDAHEGYMASGDPEQIKLYRDEMDSARAKIIAGGVVAGLVSVALGYGIYQLVTRPEAPPSAGQKRALSIIGIAPSVRGATMSIVIRY